MPTTQSFYPTKIRMGSGALGASQAVLVVKNLPANAGDVRDTGLIRGSGSSPEGRHGNPLQYPYPENPCGQRSLVGCSPQHRTESDMTEC